MRVLKTTTWDGIVSYNVYRPELINVIDRLNNGARLTATKYEVLTVTDEEALELGLLSKAEAKKKEASELEKLRAELAAMKAAMAEKSELSEEVKTTRKRKENV